MYLEEHGATPAGFTIPLAARPATERLEFDHEFSPEARSPEPAL